MPINDNTPRPQEFAAVDLGSNSFHMVIARVVDGAMQIIGRIREVIPVPLPLSVFFISPTVEGVANAILERLAVEAPAQQAAQEA